MYVNIGYVWYDTKIFVLYILPGFTSTENRLLLSTCGSLVNY